jgi:hypothetical protein
MIRSYVLQSLKIVSVGRKGCLTLSTTPRYLSSKARDIDAKQRKADQDYCVDLVQKRDREGYRKCFGHSLYLLSFLTLFL